MFNNLTFKNYRVAQWEVTPELQQMYMLFHSQLCLDRGFTTLRDLGLIAARGLMTASSTAVRDSIEAGILAGPRIVSARLHRRDRLAPRSHQSARGHA